MRRALLAVCVSAVLMSCWFTPASADPKWSYLQAGQVDFESDDGLADEDGWFGEYSSPFFRMMHLVVEYDDIGRSTLWSAGLGWHGLLGRQADLFAEVLWSDVDIATSLLDADDDGYEIAVGVRWELFNWLELNGQAIRLDLNEAGDDEGYEAGAILLGPTGRFGVGGSYRSFDDDETTKVFVRFSFGR